ncbi:MarR family winged helix-turn-helix transcriptional regulator [Pricia sp. S334]|uniref:MarR family winged helix-turn-helix transcriptional regulator n=1 Tax=Pricia mediterranea TaxID=3076079 RepID=A0ABU3L2U0_9FLAO|nr:MarR family winged helix-turn-helix transcriptional regulator [Pricia sp. S334]MDT7828055.1 MarR family winged helix-turn-helix transcriptional regulator [Pricia sp. S334]
MMHAFNPEYQNQQIEGKIVVALERISQAFRVLLWQEGKENALTPIQLQILLFIKFHESEKCKVNYLAKEFNLTKATISETVRLLSKKKLIYKETDPTDTRSYSIYLTEKGGEISTKSSSFAGALEKPIHTFSETQKEILYQSLLELIEKLNRAGIITVQRMCFSCRFYQPGKESDYCKLLKKELYKPDLRVDCPEHEIAV